MKLVNKRKDNLTFLLVIIVFLGFFIRIYAIEVNPPPLHIDEAILGQSAAAILDRSLPLLQTTNSLTVVANIFTALFIKMFGVRPLTLRLTSILLGTFTNVILFFLIKDLFSKKIAWLTFILATFSHVAIAYSRLNLPNIQSPFFLVSTFYLITLAIRKLFNNSLVIPSDPERAERVEGKSRNLFKKVAEITVYPKLSINN